MVALPKFEHSPLSYLAGLWARHPWRVAHDVHQVLSTCGLLYIMMVQLQMYVMANIAQIWLGLKLSTTYVAALVNTNAALLASVADPERIATRAILGGMAFVAIDPVMALAFAYLVYAAFLEWSSIMTLSWLYGCRD